ncbi:hypothetical protein L1987_13670 [Smallanthus sonchifolius]|uniref:Uncharacterized protein n=1 Tax=Smallanthus sonchifolius TaxID=185202 RepID=A0ACB9JH33_9ASTR|nr:hypothetical protein L1987_13670 [Smallanthus sonchifolius]
MIHQFLFSEIMYGAPVFVLTEPLILISFSIYFDLCRDNPGMVISVPNPEIAANSIQGDQTRPARLKHAQDEPMQVVQGR